MIAYGTIKVNGSVHAKFLIVYAGQDENIGYNYMQDKTNKMYIDEPYATSWTFDYEVISKSNKIRATGVPDDINHIEVIG